MFLCEGHVKVDSGKRDIFAVVLQGIKDGTHQNLL